MFGIFYNKIKIKWKKQRKTNLFLITLPINRYYMEFRKNIVWTTISSVCTCIHRCLRIFVWTKNILSISSSAMCTSHSSCQLDNPVQMFCLICDSVIYAPLDFPILALWFPWVPNLHVDWRIPWIFTPCVNAQLLKKYDWWGSEWT